MKKVLIFIKKFNLFLNANLFGKKVSLFQDLEVSEENVGEKLQNFNKKRAKDTENYNSWYQLRILSAAIMDK